MTDAERIAELEEQVAYLESELAVMQNATTVAVLRQNLGIAPRMAMVLAALYQARGRALSSLQLLGAAPPKWRSEDGEFGLLKVWICGLRKVIGFGSIQAAPGHGYRLTPEGVDKVRKALGEPASVAA